MIFKATEDEIRQIGVNAINASMPVGMGFIHFNPDDVFLPEDLKLDHYGLSLDYVHGRMVKLHIRRLETAWEIHGEPRYDYQSWVRVYPTNEALVRSVIPDAVLSE